MDFESPHERTNRTSGSTFPAIRLYIQVELGIRTKRHFSRRHVGPGIVFQGAVTRERIARDVRDPTSLCEVVPKRNCASPARRIIRIAER